MIVSALEMRSLQPGAQGNRQGDRWPGSSVRRRQARGGGRRQRTGRSRPPPAAAASSSPRSHAASWSPPAGRQGQEGQAAGQQKWAAGAKQAVEQAPPGRGAIPHLPHCRDALGLKQLLDFHCAWLERLSENKHKTTARQQPLGSIFISCIALWHRRSCDHRPLARCGGPTPYKPVLLPEVLKRAPAAFADRSAPAIPSTRSGACDRRHRQAGSVAQCTVGRQLECVRSRHYGKHSAGVSRPRDSVPTGAAAAGDHMTHRGSPPPGAGP